MKSRTVDKERNRFAHIGLETDFSEEEEAKLAQKARQNISAEFMTKQPITASHLSKQGPNYSPSQTAMPSSVLQKELHRLGNIEERPSGWNRPKGDSNATHVTHTEAPKFQTENKKTERFTAPQVVKRNDVVSSTVRNNVDHYNTNRYNTNTRGATTKTDPLLEKEMKRLENIEARPGGWGNPAHRHVGPTSHEDHLDPIEKEKHRLRALGLADSDT
eukprot:TRINITY_DN16651_c0_g1_i1.p1 TRINITY_DN16651_c0_g1~~TRINITY_DN16651_c0_g1_i1.p1  ORF type:complete len:217 (-),score=48.55 TRINITY_DN16651_c0_g1_i1:44-694(-)